MDSGYSTRTATIFADDLTGALDTAVHFAGGDTPVEVLLRPRDVVGRVLVADTETRGLRPEEAVAALEHWVPLARGLVYKKMDSTLRGPFAAEAAALARALHRRGVLVVPAYPQTGRTVRQGLLLVDGKPVHLTGAAKDPGWPITDSRIGSIVAGQTGLTCRSIELALVREGAEAVAKALAAIAGFVVADAETEADLSVLAEVAQLRPDWLPVGSAGLASALATRLGFGRAAVPAPPPHPAVVVVGSAHPASRRQVALLARSLGVEPLVASARPAAEPMECARRGYRRVGVAILTLPESRLASGAAEEAHAGLARLAAEWVRDGAATSLYATGGETLLSVLERLEVDVLQPQGELAPGVVRSSARLPGGRDLVVVSKAGGFGDDQLLVRLFSRALPQGGAG